MIDFLRIEGAQSLRSLESALDLQDKVGRLLKEEREKKGRKETKTL